MVAWWLSLTISQQVTLALALASTLVLIVDVVLFTINFYGIDKLNAESDSVSKYEIVANNDSDMFKNNPRMITIRSLNIFVAVACWLYFGLWSVLSLPAVIVISVVSGAIVSCLDSILERYIKK